MSAEHLTLGRNNRSDARFPELKKDIKEAQEDLRWAEQFLWKKF